MIDYHSSIVTALKTLNIPVHYEMTLHKGLSTPCISYMEMNNYVCAEKGNKMEYSRIIYQVKVWGNEIGTLQSLATDIDDVLRELGFTRISTGELYDNNSTMIQKILTYECLALEKFN